MLGNGRQTELSERMPDGEERRLASRASKSLLASRASTQTHQEDLAVPLPALFLLLAFTPASENRNSTTATTAMLSNQKSNGVEKDPNSKAELCRHSMMNPGIILHRCLLSRCPTSFCRSSCLTVVLRQQQQSLPTNLRTFSTSAVATMDGTNFRAELDADRAHVWHHLVQHKPFEAADPRMIVKGQGMRVWDAQGKEYIDAVSGAVWTVNVGYGRERIAQAVSKQLVDMCYFAGAAGSVPGALYASKLVSKMPGMSRVYYCNSGSEANEKVFKMVRQIAHKKYGGMGKYKILYRDRDYHGSSIGAMSAGGQDERNLQYGPMAPGFVRVPHCLEYRKEELGLEHLSGKDFGIAAANLIEQVILQEGPETVGLLCLEPITAGGGVIVPPPGYWERVQEICQTYQVLLHVDEVVCGIGRTGTHWFGYQHYGVQPDFVTMAKGVASGYAAIACMVTTEQVFDMFKSDPTDALNHFRDISTFGGCTAGPAAALENMAIIEEEDLLTNCTKMGDRLMSNLLELKEKHAVVGDVRGKGLFQGAELVKDRMTKEPVAEKDIAAVVAECAAQGVIVGASNRSVPGRNNAIMFSPALIATEADIDAITDAVDKALTKVFG